MNSPRISRDECKELRYLLENDGDLIGSHFLSAGNLAERHREEFCMWLDGASYKKIATKYGISNEQVRHDIFTAVMILKYRHNQKILAGKDEWNTDEFYPLVERAANEIGKPGLAVRTANFFARSIYVVRKGPDMVEALRNTSVEELERIYGVGGFNLDILIHAKEILGETPKEPEKPKTITERDWYDLDELLDKITEDHGYFKGDTTRAMNALTRMYGTENVVMGLLNASDQEIWTIRNVGNKTRDLLLLAREQIKREWCNE